MDLILGRFIEGRFRAWRQQEIESFEVLLDCADQDLYGWIALGSDSPPIPAAIKSWIEEIRKSLGLS